MSKCINEGCKKEAVGENKACADCINKDYDVRRPETSKKCKVCSKDKPKDEFYDRQNTCKACKSIENSIKYKNREVISMKCTTAVLLIVPTPPTVIRTKNKIVYNIEDLSDDVLKSIAAKWTEELLKKAQKKRG